MSRDLSRGSVLHWENYTFPDGGTADKFFVLVGAKQGANWVLVIATSKQKNRTFNPGCNAKEGYYHVPGGGKDFFPQDTWLLLPEALEIRPAELLKRAMDNELTVRGNLRENVVNEIRNCLRVCDDVPGTVLALL